MSTLTGEILMNVQAKKTILSVGGGYDLFDSLIWTQSYWNLKTVMDLTRV